MLEMSQHLEVNVVAYDYSGYGFSSTLNGQPIITPSERDCYENIRTVYNYLTDTRKLSPDSIIVMGRSLGTGPTCELASKHPVRAVILQSPLLSAIRVVMNTWWTLPIDIFANQDKISKINAPVFIVHGSNDVVINQNHGRQLHTLLKYPYEPIWIDGAGHNDIEADYFDQYISKMRQFISALDHEKYPKGPINKL